MRWVLYFCYCRFQLLSIVASHHMLRTDEGPVLVKPLQNCPIAIIINVGVSPDFTLGTVIVLFTKRLTLDMITLL